MAEVKKARIFLRRGSDADRLQTELCEGELGYSTDGTRVFVGDGTTTGGNSVGASMIFKAEGFDITTLTAVSSDGRAEVGDFVFTPASSYNVTTINADAPSSVISVSDYFGTVHTLSSIDAGDGSLTWMAVNSAIPFNHIVVPDNGINGNKIHGGNISGNVTFSGHLTALSSLTLDGVATSAANPSQLTGNVIYPLGITANAQVTAVSSIFDLGATTVSLGNSIGYVKAVFSTNTPISATNLNSSVTKSSAGTESSSSGVSLASHIGSTYFGTTSYASGTGTYNIKAITYTLSDIRNALQNTDITWSMIEEFYFSVYADHYDDAACFFGFANESTGDNEICFFSGSSISSGRMRLVPNLSRVIITNTYSSTEELVVHTGMDNGKISYVLTGVKVRV